MTRRWWRLGPGLVLALWGATAFGSTGSGDADQEAAQAGTHGSGATAREVRDGRGGRGGGPGCLAWGFFAAPEYGRAAPDPGDGLPAADHCWCTLAGRGAPTRSLRPDPSSPRRRPPPHCRPTPS